MARCCACEINLFQKRVKARKHEMIDKEQDSLDLKYSHRTKIALILTFNCLSMLF